MEILRDSIQCMDCINGMGMMPSGSVDLVITDPPYVIDTVGGGLYQQSDKQYVRQLDGMKDGFSNAVLDELVRVMKKINIYIFCSQKQILPLLEYFVKGKKCHYNILSWHKSNPIPACGNKYLSDTEYILFFREKGVKVYGSFKTKHTYYVTPLNQRDKKQFKHPTCKPLAILENLVVNSSVEGDTILDPFMGSGSTAVAALRHQRHYIGFEIDKGYYNICNQRISAEKNESTINTI